MSSRRVFTDPDAPTALLPTRLPWRADERKPHSYRTHRQLGVPFRSVRPPTRSLLYHSYELRLGADIGTNTFPRTPRSAERRAWPNPPVP